MVSPWLTKASLVLTCWGIGTLLAAIALLICCRKLHYNQRALLTTNLLINFILSVVLSEIPNLYYENNLQTGWHDLGLVYCQLHVLAVTLLSLTLPWSILANTVDAYIYTLDPERYPERLSFSRTIALALSPWIVGVIVTIGTVAHDMPGLASVEFKLCITALTLDSVERYEWVTKIVGYIIPGVIVLILTVLMIIQARRMLRSLDTDGLQGGGPQYLSVVAFTTAACNIFNILLDCLFCLLWAASYSYEDAFTFSDTAEDLFYLVSLLFRINLPLIWCIMQPDLLLPAIGWVRRKWRNGAQRQEVDMLEIHMT